MFWIIPFVTSLRFDCICIYVKVTNFGFESYFSVCILMLVTVSNLALIQYINGTNRSVERLADILYEKTGSSSWVVVFKALITVHHLMVHGNEVSMASIQRLVISLLLWQRTLSTQLLNMISLSRAYYICFKWRKLMLSFILKIVIGFYPTSFAFISDKWGKYVAVDIKKQIFPFLRMNISLQSVFKVYYFNHWIIKWIIEWLFLSIL